jgi:hypothetical protein
MKTVKIEGIPGYHRDMKTHAVINTNNSEYESYMRQKSIVMNARTVAANQSNEIESLKNDVKALTELVHQLLNKD